MQGLKKYIYIRTSVDSIIRRGFHTKASVRKKQQKCCHWDFWTTKYSCSRFIDKILMLAAKNVQGQCFINFRYPSYEKFKQF